jgi:hypothetical protein
MDTALEIARERRAANDAAPVRGITSAKQMEFVASQLEPPAPRENVLVVRPEDDLEDVLARL